MSRLSTRLKRPSVRSSDAADDEAIGVADNDALQESLHRNSRRGTTSKRAAMEDDEDDDYEEEPHASSRRGRSSKRAVDEDIEDTDSDDVKPERKGKRRKRNRHDEVESDGDQPSKLKMNELNVAVKTESRKRKAQPINEAYEAHLNETLNEALNEDDDETSDGHPANGFGIARSSMEAGQIIEMYLENFMCHRKFTMKFGKHVNFISGKNGSGKSSIVSALQVCLGSTARIAGRGSRMDEYIREGSQGPAIIRITMINEGPDAFEPEFYGQRITVERRIARTASGSSYILSNENGKEVSRKKSDLEKMLLNFNIFVDNPCNVMTQEESKRFIRSENKDKYAFFLKATGLSRLKDHLHDTQTDIDGATEELKKQHERIEIKKQQVKEVEELLNKMKDLESLEERIRMCRAKALWDDVRMAEQESASVKAELVEKEHQLQQATAMYEKSCTGSNDFEETVARIQQVLDEATNELRQTDEENTVKETEITKSNAELRAAKANLIKAERGRDDYVARKKQVEKFIDELRQRAMQSAEADTRGIVGQLRTLEQKLTEMRNTEKGLFQSRQDLMNEITRAEGSLRHAGNNVNAVSTQLQQQRAELQQLRRESGGSVGRQALALYPKGVVDLYNRVQGGRSRFREQVFGPLGLHLTYKEEFTAYERAIERALGPAVFAFVVTNDQDRRLMQEFLNHDPSVQSLVRLIMQKPETRYHLPVLPPHVVTTAVAIQCDNDLIFNCLVDQFNIDRTALVRFNREGMDDYVDRSGSMKSLKYGLQTVVDNERCDMLQFRNGNTSNDPNRYGFRGFLSRDMSSVMNNMEQELHLKEERLQQAEQQRAEEQAKLRELRSQEAQLQQQLRQVEGQCRSSQRELDTLNARLVEVNEAGNIDTSLQEQERDELAQAIQDLEPQVAALVARQQTLTNASKTLALAKRDLDAHRQRIVARIQEQEEEIQRLVTARSSEKRRAEGFKKRVDDRAREVDQERQRQEKAAEKVVTVTGIAEEQTREFLPDWDGTPLRLSRHENRVSLDRQAREWQAKLNASRREAGLQGYTLELLQERYDKASREYDDMNTIYETLTSELDALRTSQLQREKKWSQALRTCTKVVKTAFDGYASRKGSAGTVRFNHQEHTLDIQVQVDSTDEHSLMNDIKNLSGGERSYVTFCLQLALGHVIECPFRLLDEYDVFMDETTRSLSLQMMQRYALERPDQRQRQFLILTPHRMNEVTASSEVKVLYMPEPQRISAQGLQQQTL